MIAWRENQIQVPYVYLPHMGRVLAFDYGMKRTGLAASDNLKMIAKPIGTVLTAELHLWLKDYLSKETVDIFVVGMPSRLSGEDTHATVPVREFIAKLKEVYPNIPVDTIDERLSSHEAKDSLLLSGQKKSKRKDKNLLDTVSAALILQTYLQRIS